MSTSFPKPVVLAFRNPLILTLGLATNLTPYNYVPGNSLIEKVLQTAGVDSPPEGDLTHVVSLAYQWSSDQQHDIPWTCQNVDGRWALTEAGVEAATDLMLCGVAPIDLQSFGGIFEAPVVESAPKRTPKTFQTANVTSRYLDKRIRETGGTRGTLMNIMRRAVGTHLTVSATTGLVDDHIQNCFCRLIARDSLADRIMEGGNISDHALASFAVRAGYTDIRDWGTDPVCREMYGARTESERSKGLVLPPSSDGRVVWSNGEDSDTASAWLDIADDSASMDEMLNFQQVWSQIEQVLHDTKPHVSNRYLKILKMRADGCTMKDIAEKENVSPFRAAALMSEVRRVLRSVGVDEMVHALV